MLINVKFNLQKLGLFISILPNLTTIAYLFFVLLHPDQQNGWNLLQALSFLEVWGIKMDAYLLSGSLESYEEMSNKRLFETLLTSVYHLLLLLMCGNQQRNCTYLYLQSP